MDLVENLTQTLFSIAVAAFLLLRMERRIADLTDAINNLRYCQKCRVRPDLPFLERELKPESHDKS